MSVEIKNIVFDLGGVLIDWNPRYVYKTIFETETEMDFFFRDICTMDWNIKQDAGRTLAEATEVLIAQHPAWSEQIKAYYGRWEEMLGGPIDGTVAILKQFIEDERYRVYALTNWSAETFPVALERYDFLSWFEGIVVSGTEKCIKPHPQIYQILFDRYDLVPEESIFIDDNPDNVQGSIDLGMAAIRFENPSQLKEDLEVRGIL